MYSEIARFVRHPAWRRMAAVAVLFALVGCEEETRSPTESAPDPALATTAATPLFAQVSAGQFHSCGVSTDQRAYCWGNKGSGELGDGTSTGPESCVGATGPFPCSTRPVRVAGTQLFRQVSAGNSHSCAVATDNRAWCWGSNSFGNLGDGTRSDRLAPRLVQGGLSFIQVDAGLWHTCGVSSADRRAYCWGNNDFGQLGDGTRTQRLQPVAVFGTRKFRQVSAGDSHTCGVTTTNEAFCWGGDDFGQLGNDPVKARQTKPVLVAGGLQFRQADAGANHTCGVTAGNRAFCWGQGGQIGDGQSINRFTPRAVAGGLSVSRISAGTFHSCAETTTNQAYCWGGNSFGQLGNGGETNQLRPVAVTGGLFFAQLSAGGFHTCGKTPASVAYCWGDDFFGQLGHGTSGTGAESRAPVPVQGTN